jgi:ectoine hydroxylase-related dioxygenase (phytanoyl-CoA dioxygenase family)
METARRFPRRLQELIGYGIYNGLIGHIDKTLPAARLLADDTESAMIWDAATPPSQ